jgi:transcriptional regulator of acetoin/glycerol metabolism
MLQSYAWPGNIRELRNVLERAVLLSEGDTLGVRDLHFEAGAGVETRADEADLTLEELERRHIRRVLQEERGHVESAARRLNIPRSSLYQKIKRYRLGGVRSLESSSEF